MAKIYGIDVPFIKESYLQNLAIIQWILTYFFMTTGGAVLFAYLLFTQYWWITFLYLIWFLYDRDACKRGGKRVQWLAHAGLWKWYRDYFPIKLHKTCDLDPTENYLFCLHPHGVLSCGSFLNFGTEATGFSTLFPGMKSYLLTLTGMFWFPIFREWWMCTGSCDASKASIEWLFTKEGPGNAAVLVTGGAREVLYAKPWDTHVILKKRKGFVRTAMKHGVSLVPVYSFGEVNYFEQVDNPKGSLLRKVQDALIPIFGFAMPLMKGRGGVHMPFRTPINTVVGEPIKVIKNVNPTKEEVEELHAKYIEHLCKLFDSHKVEYGYKKDAQLQIV